jgi:hypothetical protein
VKEEESANFAAFCKEVNQLPEGVRVITDIEEYHNLLDKKDIRFVPDFNDPSIIKDLKADALTTPPNTCNMYRTKLNGTSCYAYRYGTRVDYFYTERAFFKFLNNRKSSI